MDFHSHKEMPQFEALCNARRHAETVFGMRVGATKMFGKYQLDTPKTQEERAATAAYLVAERQFAQSYYVAMGIEAPS